MAWPAFFYPGVVSLSFGIYVFERDASMVDVSFRRSHFSLKPNSSEKKIKTQLSHKDTAFHASHHGLIILEWQASGTFPHDELVLILFIFFSCCGFQPFSPSQLCVWKKLRGRQEAESQTELCQDLLSASEAKGSFCSWDALCGLLSLTHSQHHQPGIPLPFLSLHKAHWLPETNMLFAYMLHSVNFFCKTKVYLIELVWKAGMQITEKQDSQDYQSVKNEFGRLARKLEGLDSLETSNVHKGRTLREKHRVSLILDKFFLTLSSKL